MLPLIWIYVRIRTSLDGSRRHRQNLLDRIPPPPLPPSPSSRFFFSPLISFAENSANLRCTNRAEGGVESRFFFFSEGDETFSYYRIIIRMINFKNLQFIDNNKVFIFHSFRDKHLFLQVYHKFSLYHKQTKGGTQRSIKKNVQISIHDRLYLISLERKKKRRSNIYIYKT